MMLHRAWFFTLLLFCTGHAFAHVKSITPSRDELLVVKTAIGIATIVQVPDTIQSAIIGDQSSFKVEYIDKAVTIKPLRPGARTNLYLITPKQRFNLTLVPSHQDQADYVIYIKDKQIPAIVKWRSFARESKSGELTLKISRVGISSDGFILIDGTVSSASYQALRPQDFWIYQGKDSKVINSLFLSRRNVSKDKLVMLGLSLAAADIDRKMPVTLTIKDESPVSIQIPESVWK